MFTYPHVKELDWLLETSLLGCRTGSDSAGITFISIPFHVHRFAEGFAKQTDLETDGKGLGLNQKPHESIQHFT